MIRTNLKFNLIVSTIFTFSCLVMSAELNVEKIEGGISALKESLKNIYEIQEASQITQPIIRRDPFTPLTHGIITQKEDKKDMLEKPELTLSGIVHGSKQSFAIINSDVKTEGDFSGEYQVKKIIDDRVLMQYQDSIIIITMTEKKVDSNNDVKINKVFVDTKNENFKEVNNGEIDDM